MSLFGKVRVERSPEQDAVSALIVELREIAAQGREHADRLDRSLDRAEQVVERAEKVHDDGA